MSTTVRVERLALYVAAGVIIALTGAAFWLSYAHLHDVASAYGLGATQDRAWAWPATLDLFIVAGEMLMLRASLRRRVDLWAIGLTVAGSVGSIALNVAGVGRGAAPLDYIVAAVPPSAALLAFGALMRQVHVMVTVPDTAPDTAPDTVATEADTDVATPVTPPAMPDNRPDTWVVTATEELAIPDDQLQKVAAVAAEVATRPDTQLMMTTTADQGGDTKVATRPVITLDEDPEADTDPMWEAAVASLEDTPEDTTEDADMAVADAVEVTTRTSARGRTEEYIRSAVAALKDAGQEVTGTTYAEYVGGISTRTGRRDLQRVGITA